MNRGRNWLEFRYPVSDPAARVYCFPHAGGSASYYYDWAPALAPHLEVVPVQLPGRGRLATEPMCRSVAEVVDAVAPLVAESELPVILHGHSMGAILAFEVALRLEDVGADPLHVLVTGRPAPAIRSPERPVSDGSREQLLAIIRDYDATPDEVLADAELLDLILPTIRSDFRMIERYRCAPGARLRSPITVYGGTADPGVPAAAIEAWRAHTSGEFAADLLPGGHFFVLQHRERILDRLRELATDCLRVR